MGFLASTSNNNIEVVHILVITLCKKTACFKIFEYQRAQRKR